MTKLLSSSPRSAIHVSREPSSAVFPRFLRAFRNVRNGDAHFGPHSWPAPYTKSGADLFRLISHPTKTTMRIAPSLKRFRIYSATVVTNDYAQGVVQVLNFNFDFCRFGMT